MNPTGANQPNIKPLGFLKTAGLVVGAIIAFTMAYSVPHCGVLILIFLYCLLALARYGTIRSAFYGGWAIGFLAYAYQLSFFHEIFGNAAIVLWMIASFWLMLFVVLARLCFANFKLVWAAIAIPFIWTGLEYFRSELYYLRFSWLNVGYAFSDWHNIFGVYGVGFMLVALVSLSWLGQSKFMSPAVGVLIILILTLGVHSFPRTGDSLGRIPIAGVQLEFAHDKEIKTSLNKLIGEHPEAKLLVLSEYTLGGPPPKEMKAWCREHQRFLIVGGQDPTTNDNYYNTAFVISTNGEVVFKQAKSVPIQFFKDGLPAPEQKVWESPWGKIGICICYDLSYTRVTDELIRQGAQALIVPTMDVADWGKHQHELHALVAPVRAAEYGVPIFRLASSGISQAVDHRGHVIAQTSFPGEDEMLSATLPMPSRGILPVDRLLAPLCVGVTAAMIIMLLIVLMRRKASNLPRVMPAIICS